MCLKSIIPMENFPLPFLCWFEFKFKFSCSHLAQKCQNLMLKESKAFRAQVLLQGEKCTKFCSSQCTCKRNWTRINALPWVHGNINKDVSGVSSWRQPVQGNSCGPAPTSSPPSTHTCPTPACRKIKDDTPCSSSKNFHAHLDSPPDNETP